MPPQTNRRLLFATSAIAVSLGLAACSPKPPKSLPPAPGATTTTTMPETTAPQGPVPGSQEDFIASVTSDTIHFDTDMYNIDATSQQILASQAQWLARYPNKNITIEGHCDERGTREYNLALGDRRATAAKNYLVGLGVSPSRINTVSYGKERPVALGSNEAAWAQNRRAVTITVQ
ncbi:MAG: peptidoglycan-associated lipoprotein Pal [Sphingomonadales bacterium]|nr:peptidoglycan-associated lipoprotein Pal [Sphingomonadales bacterium]MDE2568200.1 peptidoglycan-associated lipoprotein Pal [Sphingomonadales bacterium]